MTETLAQTCGFVGTPRAAVYHFEASGQRCDLARQWCAEGVPALPKALGSLGRIKPPRLFERSKTQERFAIRDVSHLPPEQGEERGQ
jgi:hypothetical protein